MMPKLLTVPDLFLVQTFAAAAEGRVEGGRQRSFATAALAVEAAKKLAGSDHVGVVAVSRSLDPETGEYGEGEILYRSGRIS